MTDESEVKLNAKRVVCGIKSRYNESDGLKFKVFYVYQVKSTSRKETS